MPTRFGKNNGYKNPSIYCTDLKMLFYHMGKWVSNQSNLSDDLKDRINKTLTNLIKSNPNLDQINKN